MIRYWFAGLILVSTFSGIWSRDCLQYGTRRILFYDNVVTIAKPPATKDSVYNYWKYFQTAAGVKEVLDDFDSNQSCCTILTLAYFTSVGDTITSDLTYGLSHVSAPPTDTVKFADYILYGTVSGGDAPLYVLRLECAASRVLVKADTQVLCYAFYPPGIGRAAISNFGSIYDTILSFEKKSQGMDGLYVITPHKEAVSMVKNTKLNSLEYNTTNHTLQIYYSSPAQQTEVFTIVDLSGKNVASITRSNVSAGDKVFSWNTNGIPMGVYLLRMKSGTWISAQKIMMVK